MDADGIQALVGIARDREQYRPHAARALGYLAENGAGSKIVEADGIEALVDLARAALTRDGGHDVGWSAAMALSKLARFAELAEKIKDADHGIGALVALARCDWHTEREMAALALGNLASHGPVYCTAIKEADGFHFIHHGFKQGRDASPAASEESQPAKRLKAEAEAEAGAEAGSGSGAEAEAEVEAEQKEAEAAPAVVASTSSAQQMQARLEKVHQLMQQSQQLQQQSQQHQQQSQQLQQESQQIMAGAIEEALNGMASGSVAEAMAAASAYANAITACKAVTNCYAARVRCYAEKAEAILAENSKLEAKLREVEDEPSQGPGFEKTKEAMERREAARKEIKEWDCMTRGRYASHLRSLLGEDAIDGQDVFHIIAESNGGANHPDNFLYALGSTFNRSIGNRYDDFNAFLAGKEKTEKAVRASIKYGNRTERYEADKHYNPIAAGGSNSDPADEARRLVAKGQALMTAARAARRAGQA